jgi:hydrogenase/urease accessory protein HupE
MKLSRITSRVASAFAIAAAAAAASAHPGHEPEDFLHALAHELASPRGILALIILSVAVGLYLYAKNQKK